MTLTRPGVLLRLEGAAMLLLALGIYYVSHGSWLLMVLLVLAPDLSMLGYLAGGRVGAAVYNLAHTYLWPGILAVGGALDENHLIIHLALIWAAHIGADRLVGFGLKYPSAFRDTHLQRL